MYGVRGAFNRVTRIKHKVRGITFLRNIARWKVTKMKNKNHMYTAHDIIHYIDIGTLRVCEYRISCIRGGITRPRLLLIIIIIIIIIIFHDHDIYVILRCHCLLLSYI